MTGKSNHFIQLTYTFHSIFITNKKSHTGYIDSAAPKKDDGIDIESLVKHLHNTHLFFINIFLKPVNHHIVNTAEIVAPLLFIESFFLNKNKELNIVGHAHRVTN